MKQQLVVIELDDATLVWLSGVINGSLAPALHAALQRLIEEQQQLPLLLDLTGVTAIDEGAVSVLAAAGLQAARRGGIDLRLPGGRSHLVKDALAMRHAIDAAYPATPYTH